MPIDKKTGRKTSDKLNVYKIVKDIIEDNGIATTKDIETILKRLDQLEAKIFSAGKVGENKKTGKGAINKKIVRRSTSGPVLEMLKKSRQALDVEKIQAKTGISTMQVRSAIVMLIKAGKIRRKSRGLYEAVKEQRRPVQKVNQKGSEQNSTEAPMPVEE